MHRFLGLLVMAVAAATLASPAAALGCVHGNAASLHAARRPSAKEPLVDIRPLTPTNPCWDQGAENAFRRQYAKLGVDRGLVGFQINLAVNNVIDAVNRLGGCSTDHNKKYTSDKARVILDTVLPAARASLGDARLNVGEMRQNLYFANLNMEVRTSLEARITGLDKQVESLSRVIVDWER